MGLQELQDKREQHIWTSFGNRSTYVLRLCWGPSGQNARQRLDEEEADRLWDQERQQEEAERIAQAALDTVEQSSETAIRQSRLSQAEESHFSVDAANVPLSTPMTCFGCCRRAQHPEDRGRCGRGTMAPISLGTANGEQVSLEEFLRRQEEKQSGGAVNSGFAV